MENTENKEPENTEPAKTPEIQEISAENLLSTDSNSESETDSREGQESETEQKEDFEVSQENIDYMTTGLIWLFGSGAIMAYNMYFEDKIIEKDLYTASDKKFLKPHYDVISEKLCKTFGIGKKGDNIMMAVTFIAVGTGMSLAKAEKQSSKAAKNEAKPEPKQKEAKQEKPLFDVENQNVFEIKEVPKNEEPEGKPKKQGRPRKLK